MDRMRTISKLRPVLPAAPRIEYRAYTEEHVEREKMAWKPYRIAGLAVSVLALVMTVVALSGSDWIRYQDRRWQLWSDCRLHDGELHCEPKSYWQIAVIGLLMFAVAFGLLATLLTTCGVLAATLSQKIYYYHSAGEIYFVCALAVAMSLIVYPVAVATEKKPLSYALGSGYGIGWAGSLLYLAAAVCMCLDDIIHSVNKGLCKTCLQLEDAV